MGFLAAIAWMLYVLSRQNQLTLATLSDGRRAILYGALGLIALLIAGTDKLFSTRRRHARLDPPAGRLGGGDLADLDRSQHLLSCSARFRAQTSLNRVIERATRAPGAGTVAPVPPRDRQQRRPRGERGPPRSS